MSKKNKKFNRHNYRCFNMKFVLSAPKDTDTGKLVDQLIDWVEARNSYVGGGIGPCSFLGEGDAESSYALFDWGFGMELHKSVDPQEVFVFMKAMAAGCHGFVVGYLERTGWKSGKVKEVIHVKKG